MWSPNLERSLGNFCHHLDNALCRTVSRMLFGLGQHWQFLLCGRWGEGVGVPSSLIPRK